MTTDIKELVQRLRDRRAYQSRDNGWFMMVADCDCAEAADALEALAGEVERLKTDYGLLCDTLRDDRAALTAERDRLKAALEDIDAVAVDFGYYEAAARTMKEHARKALGYAS